jgi:hypothetical protein
MTQAEPSDLETGSLWSSDLFARTRAFCSSVSPISSDEEICARLLTVMWNRIALGERLEDQSKERVVVLLPDVEKSVLEPALRDLMRKGLVKRLNRHYENSAYIWYEVLDPGRVDAYISKSSMRLL